MCCFWIAIIYNKLLKIVSLKITEIFKSLMKNNILQLHNQSERTVEKIDCPFSMPMSRKERPPMTKPREKTRKELQAEIEGGEKKKIRQFENREKMLRQKLFKEERRTRSHRLIVRGAVLESIVPEAKGMTNEEFATFLWLALTRQTVFYI